MPYDPERHGPRRIVGPGFHEKVFEVVRRVPKGCVTSYGDVGAELGSSSVGRHVGFALAAMPSGKKAVPWHRVVNSTGRISFPADSERYRRQRKLLEKEGVRFDERGRVADFGDLRFGFGGPDEK